MKKILPRLLAVASTLLVLLVGAGLVWSHAQKSAKIQPIPEKTQKMLKHFKLTKAQNMAVSKDYENQIDTPKAPLTKLDHKLIKAKRIFLVSDIHGRFDSFKKALSDAKFSKADRLYVLGDTDDRGPAGWHALLYLTQTLPAKGYHVTVLLGNHEEMWAQIAGQGATDTIQLKNLKAKLDSYNYGGTSTIPNGWPQAYQEWKKLSAKQRQFLLHEIDTGFGQAHNLILHVKTAHQPAKWISLSHTANFDLPYNQQTLYDLSFNNANLLSTTFRNSIAKKVAVKPAQVQVFIGHISGIVFGHHETFTDLDDTIVKGTLKQFVAVPVKLYNLDSEKFIK